MYRLFIHCFEQRCHLLIGQHTPCVAVVCRCHTLVRFAPFFWCFLNMIMSPLFDFLLCVHLPLIPLIYLLHSVCFQKNVFCFFFKKVAVRFFFMCIWDLHSPACERPSVLSIFQLGVWRGLRKSSLMFTDTGPLLARRCQVRLLSQDSFREKMWLLRKRKSCTYLRWLLVSWSCSRTYCLL